MFSIARRTLIGLLVAGVSVFALACGDDAGGSNNGGGGTSGFSAGVEGDVQAGALSTEQEDTICDSYESYYSSQLDPAEVKDFSCTVSGVFAAAMAQPDTDEAAQQACTTGYDDCMAAEDNGGEEGTCKFRELPEGCTATIAEVEVCEEKQLAEFQATIDATPSCDELTLEDLEAEGGGEEETPTECQPVEEKCPALYGG